MQKLIDFLDFSSIDPQMYWRVSTLDELKEFEIMWRRETAFHWRYRVVGNVFWTLSDSSKILSDLQAESIDLISFDICVKNSLKHQVCFAAGIVSDAKILLGEEVIDDAIAEHEEFCANFIEVIHGLSPEAQVSKKQKNGLSIVKNN